ncbi:DUF5615 family PIN-like protein [Candidatus Binatia bacterium]|nr:DUF5615 family PIN-like protein [Candidatus Binatia bacterium]
MRLKLDENLPAEAADDLRDHGHDVDTVVQEGLAGRSDKVVLGAARRERRTLITLDKGVRGSLAAHASTDLPPIIVLRLHASGTKAVREASIRAVTELSSGPSFVTAVVTDSAIRVRRSST